jgi:hypothetical protein
MPLSAHCVNRLCMLLYSPHHAGKSLQRALLRNNHKMPFTNRWLSSPLDHWPKTCLRWLIIVLPSARILKPYPVTWMITSFQVKHDLSQCKIVYPECRYNPAELLDNSPPLDLLAVYRSGILPVRPADSNVRLRRASAQKTCPQAYIPCFPRRYRPPKTAAYRL